MTQRCVYTLVGKNFVLPWIRFKIKEKVHLRISEISVVVYQLSVHIMIGQPLH